MPRHNATERIPASESPSEEKKPKLKLVQDGNEASEATWKAGALDLIKEGQEALETGEEQGEIQAKDAPQQAQTDAQRKRKLMEQEIHRTLKEQNAVTPLDENDLDEIEDLTEEAETVLGMHDPDVTEITHLKGQSLEREKEGLKRGAAIAAGREAREIRDIQARLANDAVDSLVAEQHADENPEYPAPQNTSVRIPQPRSFLRRIQARLPKWLGGK